MSESKMKSQVAKYGDIELLFKSIANYLRKALVAFALISTKKTGVIEAIDAALIDPRREDEIAALFAPWALIV
jgi:hypothetical protein